MRDRRGDQDRRSEPGDVQPLELDFAVDEEATPTAVTAFPRRGLDEATAWITIDVAHLVDLVEHA